MAQEKPTGLSSFHLHLLAMALMLCDHLWATLFPQQEWMTCIGRMAFPLFAFCIVEGYFHTSNIRNYIGRILIFALLSEIPFDLIYGSSVFYPFHQNVLWTFLIGLLAILACEKARTCKRRWMTWLLLPAIVLCAYVLGMITMVDYFGAGVLMVLTFYFFHGKDWRCLLGQLVCLAFLNIHILGTYFYPVTIAGYEIKIMQQGFALLALLPIWLYHGRQGYHSKAFQYSCYAFYPVHLLVLYCLWQYMNRSAIC